MRLPFGRSAVTSLATPRTNVGERIYAIGDVHGCADLLKALLRRINDHAEAVADRRDVHLVFLGDLVDRGPDSAEVLRIVHDLDRRSDAVIVLAGNHEDFMLRAMDGEPGMMRAWMRSGGRETLRSFGIEAERGADPDATADALRQALPSDLLQWLRNRPLTARSGDYLFCHAGIRPGRDLRRQTRADLLWIRDEFLEDSGNHGVVVVHGHSISDAVEMRSNRIGIDTGAYRTGVLTAICLDDIDREIVTTEGVFVPEQRS